MKKKRETSDVKNESDVNVDQEEDDVIILKKKQNYLCEFMKICTSSAEEE